MSLNDRVFAVALDIATALVTCIYQLERLLYPMAFARTVSDHPFTWRLYFIPFPALHMETAAYAAFQMAAWFSSWLSQK